MNRQDHYVLTRAPDNHLSMITIGINRSGGSFKRMSAEVFLGISRYPQGPRRLRFSFFLCNCQTACGLRHQSLTDSLSFPDQGQVRPKQICEKPERNPAANSVAAAPRRWPLYRGRPLRLSTPFKTLFCKTVIGNYQGSPGGVRTFAPRAPKRPFRSDSSRQG